MQAWLIIYISHQCGCVACSCFIPFFRLFIQIVVLVEKILRVQPDVKKLFLLVRAADDESAKQRVETEVKKARYLLPSSFRPVVVSIIACFSCAN
jgi:hypothetical protein